MSTYKRLFTFGCSYTSWKWKTWADILGESAEEFYNFGQPGGGNEQIFFRIIEANKKYNFTKDDTVAVCWTYYFRKDRWEANKWTGKETPSDWHKGWDILSWFKKEDINPDEQYLKTLSYISACNSWLPKICKYLSFSVVDFSKHSKPSRNVPWESNVQKKFESESTQFDNKNYNAVFDILDDTYCEKRISKHLRPVYEVNGLPDKHPTPLEHAYFLENILGIHINEETKEKISEWEIKMRHSVLNKSDG